MVIKSLYTAWTILAKNNLQNQLLTPSSSFLFIIGKFLNFVFSIFIILAVFHQTSSIQGYSVSQAVIFVLVFNVVDSITQFFFRSLYSFRPLLVRGDFDLDLLKPLPSFFRPILSGPDFLDVPLIIIKIGSLIYFFHFYHFSLSLSSGFLFLILFINALVIAFALHLSIAAFSIITTEIDSLVALYRSLGQAAVIPTDIYQGFFRFLLDYLIPITAMVTIPAKTLINLTTTSGVIYSCLVAIILLTFSLLFWQFAIKRYSSASS